MAETALAALQRAVGAALAADAGVSAWVGDRIYADLAPARTPRPYIVFAWMGGGEVRWQRGGDAQLVLLVQAVALTQTEALAIAAAIDARLDDADLSQGARALDGGAEWAIVNCSGGLAMHLVETIDGIQLYHEGQRYSAYLQRK